MKKIKNSSQGFTLLELLVVVLIIGILAAIALPQYKRVVIKSKGSQLLSFLHTLDRAQRMYRLQNGTWAKKFSDLDIDLSNLTSNNSFSCWMTFTSDDQDSIRGVNCRLTGHSEPTIEKYMKANDINCWLRGGGKAAEEICYLLGGKEGQKDLIWYIPF